MAKTKVSFDKHAFLAKLNQVGDRAEKGVSDVMRRRAREIRDLARSYAPVQTGLLPKNIDYVTRKDGNRRNEYEVYISLDADEGRRHDTLGDFVPTLEKRLTPYGRGPLKLGKSSQAKRMMGNDVGGKFFERAVEEGTRQIREEAQAAARGKSYPSVARAVVASSYRPKTNAQNRSRNVKRKNRKT